MNTQRIDATSATSHAQLTRGAQSFSHHLHHNLCVVFAFVDAVSSPTIRLYVPHT